MRRFAFGMAIATCAALAPIWANADDRQIAQTIVSNLKEQKAAGDLKGFDIDLEVKSGEVLLSGYVSSKDQQTLAIDAARYVEGVKKVVNDLKIRDESRESKQVGFTTIAKKQEKASREQQIEEQYSREESNAKEAESKDSDESDSAAAATAPAPPVLIEPDGAESDSNGENATLANEIIAELKRLKKSGELKGFGVNLDVEKGIVRLTGKVSSFEQQDLVIETVRSISGVKKVINELQVPESTTSIPAELPVNPVEATPASGYGSYSARTSANAGPESDAMAIVQDVVSRLQDKRDEGVLRGFDVDVRCDDGSILLTGTVPSVDQQVAVLDVVRRTPGVKQVVNNLAIAGLQVPAAYVAGPNGPVQVAPAQLAPISAGNVAPAVGRPAQVPMAFAPARLAGHNGMVASQAGQQGVPMSTGGMSGSPVPMQTAGYGIAPARYDHPQMPGYAWPSYASHPNYAAVTYPKQYSATAWPYIGPFYPYPQVPLGWRKVSLEWDDGWWMLDFKDR